MTTYTCVKVVADDHYVTKHICTQKMTLFMTKFSEMLSSCAMQSINPNDYQFNDRLIVRMSQVSSDYTTV